MGWKVHRCIEQAWGVSGLASGNGLSRRKENSMRVMIINPDWGMTREQMDARCEILSGYVAQDVELSMECLTKTRVYLDSAADGVYAGPEILEMAVRAEQEGYDAVVLYCFSDPVMEACRQVVDIPVVGAGQAACLMVPLVGYQGAVLLADKKRIPEKKHTFFRIGLASDRICGYDGLDGESLDPIQDREALLEAFLAAGRRALEGTGAQVLVLGCTSFLGMAPELERRLHVPVIDPGPAGVAMAEAMVRQRLASGKKAFLSRKDCSFH